MSEATVTEALLLRWNEGPNGRTVTFQLPDDTPQHPFRGLKAGPTHGQRLALSIALIADDETQSPPADNQPKEKKRAQEAGRLCTDPRFMAFLGERYNTEWYAADGDPAEVVRRLCHVNSRAILDKSEAGAMEWDALRGEYIAWLQVAA